MALKDTVVAMKKLLGIITKDIEKATNGNKAASQRVRTATIKFEKIAKKFRKESVAAGKKKKTTKKKAPAKRKAAKKTTKKKAPAKRKAAKKTTKRKAPKRRATAKVVRRKKRR